MCDLNYMDDKKGNTLFIYMWNVLYNVFIITCIILKTTMQF